MNDVAPWWTGFSPVEVEVECANARHRLRWAEGHLIALDHPDTEGERTLAALGGERHRCVSLVEAWERHRENLRVLTLGPRGPSDRLRISAPAQQTTAGGWLAYAPATGLAFSGVSGAGGAPGMGGPDPQAELVDLLALGDPLARRLSAAVSAAWTDSARVEDDASRSRSELTAAVYGRMLCSLQTWLGVTAIDLQLTICHENDDPELQRDGSTIVARAPVRWLHQVWARNLAVVGDNFVLDVVAADIHLSLRTLDTAMNESNLTIESREV